MATHLGDLGEYFDPGLTLTVRGTVYTVPLPSAELGLWCQHMASLVGVTRAQGDPDAVRAAVEKIADLKPPGDPDAGFEEIMLGAVYAEMVAAKVPHPHIVYCATTAYTWIVAGEEAAAEFWQSGGRPEAPSPANRQARRAAAKTTSTGGASTTRKPTSTSGTSTPNTSGRSGRARRSRGKRSSGTGRS